jgi:hypothetical protein
MSPPSDTLLSLPFSIRRRNYSNNFVVALLLAFLSIHLWPSPAPSHPLLWEKRKIGRPFEGGRRLRAVKLAARTIHSIKGAARPARGLGGFLFPQPIHSNKFAATKQPRTEPN